MICNMRRHLLFISIILLFVSSSFFSLFAVPIGNSDKGREYRISAEDFSKWCCGFYSRSWRRNVNANGLDYRMKSNKYVGYIGYDIRPWLNLYVVGAENKAKLEISSQDESVYTTQEYGIGLHFNLLDHALMAPTLYEDRFRINAECLYYLSEVEIGGIFESWAEFYASATVSIVRTLDGESFFVPNAIVLFAGPIFSDLQGAIDEEIMMGYTAGIEIYHTEITSMHARVDSLDSDTLGFGFHLRF